MKNRLIFVLLILAAALTLIYCQTTIDQQNSERVKPHPHSAHPSITGRTTTARRGPINTPTTIRRISTTTTATTQQTDGHVTTEATLNPINDPTVQHSTTRNSEDGKTTITARNDNITTTTLSTVPVTTTSTATTSSATTPSTTVTTTSVTSTPASTQHSTSSSNTSISPIVSSTTAATSTSGFPGIPPPKVAQHDMGVLDYIAAIGAGLWILIITIGFATRDMFFDNCLRRFHSESVTISEHERPLLKKSPIISRPQPVTSQLDTVPESSQRSTNLESFKTAQA